MLLSDEQIQEAMEKAEHKFRKLKPYGFDDESADNQWRAIAKAQLIAVWDWLMEPCGKHPYYVGDAPYIIGRMENKRHYAHRKDCPQCMAEFEAEVQKYKSDVKE